MSKKSNKILAPRWRFPEFKDKNTWVEQNLSEVLFEHREKSTGKEEVYSVSVHKGVVNQIEHLGRKFAASNTENYKRVLPGDIIYTKSPTGDFPLGIIKQSKISKPVIVSPLYGVFKPKTIDLGVILDAYFESPEKTVSYLSSIVQKGAKNTINISNDTFLSNFLILPTDKLEQQKIANCLLSLDGVIVSEKQKLNVLKNHKKGLLHSLFTQEGETLPVFRFKEFIFSTKWESRKLKDVFSIFQGFAFPSNTSVNKGIRWLKIADVSIQHMNHGAPSYLPIEFMEKYKNFLLKEGDYVIALTRPVLGQKLKISKIDNVFHNSLLNQRVGKLISSNCIDFVYYLLQTTKLISVIEQNIAGSEPPNLSIRQIEDIEVYIPSSKQEQHKVAEALTSIDDLIIAQSQKLDALKRHKKGLFQGLFPDVNKVKG